MVCFLLKVSTYRQQIFLHLWCIWTHVWLCWHKQRQYFSKKTVTYNTFELMVSSHSALVSGTVRTSWSPVLCIDCTIILNYHSLWSELGWLWFLYFRLMEVCLCSASYQVMFSNGWESLDHLQWDQLYQNQRVANLTQVATNCSLSIHFRFILLSYCFTPTEMGK